MFSKHSCKIWNPQEEGKFSREQLFFQCSVFLRKVLFCNHILGTSETVLLLSWEKKLQIQVSFQCRKEGFNLSVHLNITYIKELPKLKSWSCTEIKAVYLNLELLLCWSLRTTNSKLVCGGWVCCRPRHSILWQKANLRSSWPCTQVSSPDSVCHGAGLLNSLTEVNSGEKETVKTLPFNQILQCDKLQKQVEEKVLILYYRRFRTSVPSVIWDASDLSLKEANAVLVMNERVVITHQGIVINSLVCPKVLAAGCNHC